MHRLARHRLNDLYSTKEIEETILADEIHYDRFEFIRFLLEEKSKILTDIDEEILGISEITRIENEIEESVDVIGQVIGVKHKVHKVKFEAKKKRNTNASMVMSNRIKSNFSVFFKTYVAKKYIVKFKAQVFKWGPFWDSSV